MSQIPTDIPFVAICTSVLGWKPLAPCKRKDCNVDQSKHILLVSANSPDIRTTWTILRQHILTFQSQQALQQVTISADLWNCELTFCKPSTAVSVPTRLSAQQLRVDKTSMLRSFPVRTNSGSLCGSLRMRLRPKTERQRETS